MGFIGDPTLWSTGVSTASDPRWGDGWVLQSRLARARGDLESATRCAERAEKGAREHGWLNTRATLFLEMGEVSLEHGLQAQAAEWLQQGLEQAASIGDAVLCAHFHRARGMCHFMAGERAEAETSWRRALDFFGAAPREGLGRGRCHLGLARLYRQRGELEEAARHNRLGREEFRRIGARNAVAGADNQLGEISRQRGALDEAATHYAEALAVWEAMGAGNAVYAQANLAVVRMLRGDHVDARRRMGQALQVFDRRKQWAMAASAHAALLLCAAHAADWLAFDRHAQRVMELVEDTGFCDADTARWLDEAAEVASYSRSAKARRARALADEQWARLGGRPSA